MSKKRNLFWKFFRIIATLILILVVAIAVIPVIFKGQILERVKQEINKQVEAKVDFMDFGVNLINHFPNLTVSMEDLSVEGVDEFEGDTLASIKSLSAVVDLVSVFKGDAYLVKSILVTNPKASLIINEDEKPNWEILPHDTTADVGSAQKEAEGDASFKIALKKFTIKDANILYQDVPGNTLLKIKGLNHTLSGDISADRSVLKTNSTIESLSFEQDGISYLYKTILEFEADFDADIKNSIYKFEKNRVKLNALILEFNGSVAMAGDDLNILVTFNAPKNTFNNVLSLIPAIFMKDFEDIKTNGTFSLNGYVKGLYNEQNIPSFGVDLKVDDGMFKYPDLPNSVENIVVRTTIDNKGGDIDNTIIDISKFSFSMIDNPFDVNMVVKTPVSDPYIRGKIDGVLDLASIQKVYPLSDNESMEGVLNLNVALEGHLSTIEKEEYDKFKAMGSFLVEGLNYHMKGYSEPIIVSLAQLNFSPEYLDLVGLDFKYASTDIKASGKIENYISYIIGDGTLKGNLKTQSRNVNVNDFMEGTLDEEEEAVPVQEEADPVEVSVFKVPAKIDFELNSAFDELMYDNILMKDVKGKVIVNDQKVWMKGLRGKLFNGNIAINGSYDSKDKEKPVVDLELDINGLNIQQAAETFTIMKKYAPIARHTIGEFSSKFSFNTVLGENMMPDWTTLAGSGLIYTSRISIENVNTLNKLSDVLKTDKFRKLDLNAIKMYFEIVDGKVNVKPFDLKMKDMKATLSGWTAVDQTINYKMDMEIPRNVMGTQANDVLEGLVSKANQQGANFSLGETINLDVFIGGTLTDPSVKTGLAKGEGNVVNNIKKNIQEELDKQKEELEKKAKEEAQEILDDANKKAKEILTQAQKQADQIKKSARDAAQEGREEAEKQAKKLLEEAKKKGTLAEIAAKKTTDELKKEANNKADQMVQEADKQADIIIKKARQEAAKIKQDAQNKISK